MWLTGYAQRREQEAREQQENITAMEALNNLFVVTKQQQQQPGQLRPAETVSHPPTAVNHNHKEAGATPTSASVSQSQAGAVPVQVCHAYFVFLSFKNTAKLFLADVLVLHSKD